MTAPTTTSPTTVQPLVLVSAPTRRPLADVARALATRVADQLGASAVALDDAVSRAPQPGNARADAPVVVVLLDADSALELCCDSRHDRPTRSLAQALARAQAGECRIVPVLYGVRCVAVPPEFAALHALTPVLLSARHEPHTPPGAGPAVPFCRSIDPDSDAASAGGSASLDAEPPVSDPRELDAAATIAVRIAVTSVVAGLERCPTVTAARALPAPTVRRVGVELAARAVRHAAATRALLLLRALHPDAGLPPVPASASTDEPGITELTLLAALTSGELDGDGVPSAALREAAGRFRACYPAGFDRRPLLAGTLALLVRLTRESGRHADLVDGLPSSQALHRQFAACRVTGPGRAFHTDRHQAHALLATLLGHVDAALLAALTGSSPWPSRR